jgi:hypothetical protein
MSGLMPVFQPGDLTQVQTAMPQPIGQELFRGHGPQAGMLADVPRCSILQGVEPAEGSVPFLNKCSQHFLLRLFLVFAMQNPGRRIERLQGLAGILQYQSDSGGVNQTVG